MHGAPLLACLALTLALLAWGAPAPQSPGDMQLQQLLLDLQRLQHSLSNRRNPKLSKMLTFQFYLPPEVTERRQLQCLVEELVHLENVLGMAQGTDKDKKALKELMGNINATAQELKGPGPSFECNFGVQAVSVVDFLSAWVGFCQGLFLTAA